MATSPTAPSKYFIGVDVGTNSVRAAVVDALALSRSGLYQTSLPRPADRRDLLLMPSVIPVFDSVVLDRDLRPVTVSSTGKDEVNVIAWMDHRAAAEAKFINDSKDDVLAYVGGTISPEMEVPKLLWLKRYMPATWSRAAHFLDLTDYLTLMATGSLARSVCTLTCKWTYLAHQVRPGGSAVDGWSNTFFTRIGLEDLVNEGYRRIGTEVQPIGTLFKRSLQSFAIIDFLADTDIVRGNQKGHPLANGLSLSAASSLGLAERTPVATGLIDAHSGGLGMLGAALPGELEAKMDQRLAIIAGTSTCHMAVASGEPKFVPGVWGPYRHSLLPDYWLHEGGQSATGKLVDHVINTHPAIHELKSKASAVNQSIYAWLDSRLVELAKIRGLSDPTFLTTDIHMLPDFHGNRSPRADPSLTGIWTGLTLDVSIDDLALRYLACLQAIIYGTLHIISTLREKGLKISALFQTGGFSHSSLFLQQTADATGCVVVLPREGDAVLVGAAVTAAAASGTYPGLQAAMRAMNHAGRSVVPCTSSNPIASFHARKYHVFLQLHQHSMMYRSIMKGENDASLLPAMAPRYSEPTVPPTLPPSSTAASPSIAADSLTSVSAAHIDYLIASFSKIQKDNRQFMEQCAARIAQLP